MSKRPGHFVGTKKMEYKGHQWHDKCFCCCTCKNPIGTRSFIPRDNDIYCTTCYEEKFSTRCIKCNQVSSFLSNRRVFHKQRGSKVTVRSMHNV